MPKIGFTICGCITIYFGYYEGSVAIQVFVSTSLGNPVVTSVSKYVERRRSFRLFLLYRGYVRRTRTP